MRIHSLYASRVRRTFTGGVWLAAVLLLSGTGVRETSNITWAEEPASPQERIRKIEDARKDVERVPSKQEEKPKQVTISGKVHTSDGRPLKELGRGGIGTVTIESRSGKDQYAGSSSLISTVGAEGEFSFKVQYGEITLTADWEGTAPVRIGPIAPEGKDQLGPFDIKLDAGFPAAVRLVGPEGEQILSATIEARLDNPAASQPRTQTADEKGLVVIEHAAGHPYTLKVAAPGYARNEFKKILLQRDEPVTLKLDRAMVKTGIVTDSDGKPLEGVRVRLFARLPSANSSHIYGQHGAVLTMSDRDGRFRIDTLRADERAAVLFEADAFGSEVRELTPGDEEMSVRLGPKRVLRGEIVGDLSRLEKRFAGGRSPQPSVTYKVRVQVFGGGNGREFSYRHGDLAAVKASDEDPRRGTFELVDLLPGELVINAGPAKRIVEPFNSLRDGITIDLDQPTAGGPPRRKVVLRFVPPKPDAPLPTGDLRVDLRPMGEDADHYHQQFRAPIRNGQIEVLAFAPGTFSVLNQGMVGYWFDESQLGVVNNVRAVAIPAEDDEEEKPFELTFPVEPAGAIRGRVLAVDGDELPHTRDMRLDCSPAPEDRHEAKKVSAASIYPNTEGEFIITPVPFGASYQVTAHFGVTKVFSAPVTLSAEHPLEKVELKLPKLVKATVRVIDTDGDPLQKISVDIERSYPGQFVSSTSRRTDETGRVTFSDLAADRLEDYRVKARHAKNGKVVEARIKSSDKETILILPADKSKQRAQLRERIIESPVRSVAFSLHSP